MSAVEAEPNLSVYGDLLAELDAQLNDIAAQAALPPVTASVPHETAAAQAPAIAETVVQPVDAGTTGDAYVRTLPASSAVPVPATAAVQFESVAEPIQQQRTRVGEKIGAMLGKTWRTVSGRNLRARHAAEHAQAMNVVNEAFAGSELPRRRDHRRLGYALLGIATTAAVLAPAAVVVASANGSSIGVQRLGDLGKFRLPGIEHTGTAAHQDRQPAQLGAFRKPHQK